MKLNFKYHISFISIITLACAFSIFAGVSYITTKSYLEKEIIIKQMGLMKILQKDINGWINLRMDIVSGLAREIEKREFTREEDLVPLLSSARYGTGATQVYIGFETAEMYFYDGRTKSLGYDPRVRPWYQEGMSATKTIISKPFIGISTNQLTIGILSPIDMQNKRVGVVSLAFFANQIFKRVQENKIDQGYAFIIDADGQIIIHPDKDLLNNNLQANSELIDAYKYITKHKEGVYEYKFRGESKIMAFGKLSNGWYTIVTLPKEEAYSFLETLKMLFFIIGSILLVLSFTIIRKVEKII